MPGEVLPGFTTIDGRRYVVCPHCDWTEPAPGNGFARAAQPLRDHLTKEAQ